MEDIKNILVIRFLDDKGRRCTTFHELHHVCTKILDITIYTEDELVPHTEPVNTPV